MDTRRLILRNVRVSLRNVRVELDQATKDSNVLIYNQLMYTFFRNTTEIWNGKTWNGKTWNGKTRITKKITHLYNSEVGEAYIIMLSRESVKGQRENQVLG